MCFTKQLNRIKRLDGLIRRKSTGPPDNLARRLDVSRATLFRHIDELRTLGAPIAFDKSRQSYCYTGHFELKL